MPDSPLPKISKNWQNTCLLIINWCRIKNFNIHNKFRRLTLICRFTAPRSNFKINRNKLYLQSNSIFEKHILENIRYVEYNTFVNYFSRSNCRRLFTADSGCPRSTGRIRGTIFAPAATMSAIIWTAWVFVAFTPTSTTRSFWSNSASSFSLFPFFVYWFDT